MVGFKSRKHSIGSSLRIPQVVMSIICLVLTACGGGGSGGGGGGGTGGGPSRARQEFPSQILVSFPEPTGPSFQFHETSFPFYSPTDALPSDFQLIGTDATPFRISILATNPPDSAGNRTVTLRLDRFGAIDFEEPTDANKDNIYEFRLSGLYRGETLTVDYKVTITDSPDPLTSVSRIIHGEAVNQMFGGSTISIPDITGDGKPEVGTSIMSGLGPASAYIIGSEFYGSVSSGPLNVSTLGNNGTKFLQTPYTTTPVSLNRSITQQNLRANMLTARASSTGVELLLSDAPSRKLYLWDIRSPSDYASLRGSVDPASSSSAIVYSFDPAGGVQEGRLIPDVNGDGRNDIFVQSVQKPGGGTTFGIIFGRPLASAGDRQRTGAFDITLTTSEKLGTYLPYLVIHLASDMDRDGFPDLIISAPAKMDLYSDHFSGPDMWVIRSNVLRSTASVSINLDAITSSQGRYIVRDAFTLLEVDDLDNDGLKSLYVGFDGRSSAAGIIDGDDFLAGNLGSPPGRFVTPGIGRDYAAIGDVDGDSIPDFVTAPLLAKQGQVVQGGAVKTGFISAPAITGGRIIQMNQAISYSQFESRHPSYLKESELVAFGFASVDGINGVASDVGSTAGRIVLVKEADIRRALTSTATMLDVR